MSFEKTVTVEPGYEKLKEGYGIAACKIRFVLKRNNKAVQFLISTDWYVPSARLHLKKFKHLEPLVKNSPSIDGWDVGYHSPTPRYEGQSRMDQCDVIEGDCYYDGSGLRAGEWVEDFIAGGTDWLWPKLEKEYYLRFPEEK